MVTDVNHDSGDSGDTGDSGEHGTSQGGDSGHDTGFGNDDSGFSDSGNDENQNGYGHESASEDYGHQFSPVQEHMGFTTGFGPAADLPRNAFGVPDYRGFSMPDNKANSLSFGKSPESYGSQSGMTFGTSFNPNSSLPKNAFGVPEYRGFRMPNGTLIGVNEQKGESWFGANGLTALAGGASVLENWKTLLDKKSFIPTAIKVVGTAMAPEKFRKLRDDINIGDIPNDFRDVR
ncbi:MAG: hypothetical protein ACLGSA_14985 [Acidobacteriota bacterium]